MSLLANLRSFEDTIDFRRVWRVGSTLSLVLVLVGAGAILVRGLNLGIDFEGGTSWDVPSSELSVEDTRDALRDLGEAGAKIQTIGRGGSRIVRVQTDTPDEAGRDAVSAALADAAGVEPDDISVSVVGPSWGDQITEKAQRALVFFFIAIAVYIAVRLEWKMAVGALASVVHDLVVAVGVYALFQFEVTPATVIAFMTILGYSLYDTIVIFDRIKDNAASVTSAGRRTYTGIVSLSLNQVLMRSINTTVSSLLPVLSLLVIGSWIMGAVALQEFAVALAIGLVVGAYSSITVASPLVAWLKEREPRYREIRRRAERFGAPSSTSTSAGPATPVTTGAVGAGTAAAGTAAAGDDTAAQHDRPGPAPSRPTRTAYGASIPPRPRKKGRRR